MEIIIFTQVEDNMVTFEKTNGETIIYPISLVPIGYKEGDIIKVIIHDGDFIEFLELDTDEMERRRVSIMNKKSSLRDRARRSTNA